MGTPNKINVTHRNRLGSRQGRDHQPDQNSSSCFQVSQYQEKPRNTIFDPFFFSGKGWTLAKNHIGFTIGRHSYNVRDIEGAYNAYQSLLTHAENTVHVQCSQILFQKVDTSMLARSVLLTTLSEGIYRAILARAMLSDTLSEG